MSEKTPVTPPERNLKTHAVHRKEVWWQIILPLCFGCLILILVMAGVIWAAVGSSAQVSRWADISLILLIPLQLCFGLLGLGVVIGVTILISKLLGGLPGFTWKVQKVFTSLQQITLTASNALVKPILKLEGWSAGARRARHMVAQPLKPAQPREDERI